MGRWRTASASLIGTLFVIFLLINSEDEANTKVPKPSHGRTGGEANPSKFGRRDVSGNTTQPPELTLEGWMRSKERGYEEDRDRIARTCKKYGKKLETDPVEGSKNFMVDKKHKWAYCRHGKV